MKFKLTEKIERTAWNAWEAFPSYVAKYGANSSFLELKYNFRLSNEELLWLVNRAFEKGLINEYSKDYAIQELELDNLEESLDEDLDISTDIKNITKEVLNKYADVFSELAK